VYFSLTMCTTQPPSSKVHLPVPSGTYTPGKQVGLPGSPCQFTFGHNAKSACQEDNKNSDIPTTISRSRQQEEEIS
jgi:hypothetical protein